MALQNTSDSRSRSPREALIYSRGLSMRVSVDANNSWISQKTIGDSARVAWTLRPGIVRRIVPKPRNSRTSCRSTRTPTATLPQPLGSQPAVLVRRWATSITSSFFGQGSERHVHRGGATKSLIYCEYRSSPPTGMVSAFP